MSKYKIIMTGGGTAGHVNPNLALIPSLEKNNFEGKNLNDVEYIDISKTLEKLKNCNNSYYFIMFYLIWSCHIWLFLS